MSFHDERQVGGTEPNGDEGGPHLDGSQVQRRVVKNRQYGLHFFPGGQWTIKEALEGTENMGFLVRQRREQPGSLL